jgi:hypothetical protein
MEEQVRLPQGRPGNDKQEHREFEEEQNGGECEYAVHPKNGGMGARREFRSSRCALKPVTS